MSSKRTIPQQSKTGKTVTTKMTPQKRNEKIKQGVIKCYLSDNPENFTTEGFPKDTFLEKTLGFAVKAVERNAVIEKDSELKKAALEIKKEIEKAETEKKKTTKKG